jgi:uncharacterized protein YbjT (DUF2867 family)
VGDPVSVLVVGATGDVAGHLTDRLLAAGVRVRALVRDRAKAAARWPDLTPVVADLEDPTALDRAFAGVEQAFVALGTSRTQVPLERGLIDAAARARVPHVVRLSVYGPAADSPYPVARRHAELDAHLAATGLVHTLLRPTYFTSNLLAAAAAIAQQGRWSGTPTDGRVAAIDTRDVAEAAAAVLTDPTGRGSVHDLTGPEALTMTEIAQRFTAVLGRPVAYVPVPEPAYRQALAGRGLPGWLVDYALGVQAVVQDGAHRQVTDGVERLTGRPARPVDDFVRAHAQAFLG